MCGLECSVRRLLRRNRETGGETLEPQPKDVPLTIALGRQLHIRAHPVEHPRAIIDGEQEPPRQLHQRGVGTQLTVELIHNAVDRHDARRVAAG